MSNKKIKELLAIQNGLQDLAFGQVQALYTALKNVDWEEKETIDKILEYISNIYRDVSYIMDYICEEVKKEKDNEKSRN